MKPTDEEIEKEASDRTWTDWPENTAYFNGFRDGAKWARDQQKIKPLEWDADDGMFRADTEFGDTYIVFDNIGGYFLQIIGGGKSKLEVIKCASTAESRAKAQEHFEERVKKMFV